MTRRTRSIFKFATFTDGLLLAVGSLFAITEGAGPAFMSLVFGGMTNTLVTTVQRGFAEPANGTMTITTEATTTTQPPPPPPPIATNQTTVLSNITNTNDLTDLGVTASATAGALLTPEEFESELALFSVLYVLIGVAIYFSSLVQITCWQTACERQVHRMRLAFFRSVLRQELAWFDRNQAGELGSKFNDDIERVRDGLGEQFSSIIKYSSSFVSGFLVGFIVSWRLTLVILAVTPLLAIFSAFLGKMLATSSKREQEKYASAGALAEEVLTSIRTVFALGGQQTEIKKYTRKLHEGKKMAQSKYLRLSIIFGGSLFVLYSTYGLALYVASDLLSANLITPGGAMTVIMAVMMGASALGNIIPPFQTVIMASSSANLIYDIIESVPRIDALSDRGLKLSKVTANIKFENVTFAYPLRSNVPVLKNLNFELNQGQTVAFCGRTGSGKSTIMNLLLRFYDPQRGCIYLDNCNLCDLNVAWLRSLIGIVEQEPALFDCSIYENISLGASQESDKDYQRVIEAAKLANAHDFIMALPDGYETRCGDRGVQMSGGQKQRIAIARALLCDPKILLLDEATSALDSENEFMVQSALNRARQGRTTIIIAHRLSTIRDADSICVMSDGVIVERGRHNELMAKRGEYYNLVTNQVFVDEDSSSNGAGPGGRQAASLDSDSSTENHNRRALTPAGGQLAQLDSDEDGGGGGDAINKSYRSRRSIDRETSKLIRRSPIAYESINRPIKSMIEFQSSQLDERAVELPTFKDIMKLIKPERGRYIISLFASFLSGAILPTFALFYAQIFDTFTKTGDELLASGAFWALMFIVLATANFITMFFRIVSMAWSIEASLARIRSECFANILRQHVGWFDRINNSPQRLATRLAADVPQIKAVLNARLSTMIAGVATIVSALFIAFYLGWQLAILLTVALPLLLYVGYLQMRISRGDHSQHVRRMENASRLATETIEHIKLVQSINQERFFFEKFNKELQGPLKDSMASARRFGLIYGLSQSLLYFVYGAAFRWGAYLMAREILDPITVFRIFFSIAFTAIAVGQWGGLSSDMSRANYAIGMVVKLLNTQSAIDNLSRGGFKPQRNDLKGSISFQDVHFRYPTRPDTQVLQGLNLEVQAGKTLALVGPSGMGKSTIAALLLRFYDPDRGVVRIDNYDVRCINLNHLRRNVGLVSQEPVLFKASIKENILYGLDPTQFSMRDVKNAAKLANIDEFIESLPYKYDTMVGDRGSQLSGGQKQRIAIARTMIRNPTILILDEATSALDSESEALVNQALEKAAQGKTCIKIAHRLSTVRDADKIAVIERGQVVEEGTHDELMSIGKRGYYFKLMQKQEFSS
uniref:Multidrug resistance protein 1 n=1 Tax=Aceria tosichella TaxID=561515 RepID=A0A6G1S6F0_9ACAR